jgi:hypothetical protein
MVHEHDPEWGMTVDAVRGHRAAERIVIPLPVDIMLQDESARSDQRSIRGVVRQRRVGRMVAVDENGIRLTIGEYLTDTLERCRGGRVPTIVCSRCFGCRWAWILFVSVGRA